MNTARILAQSHNRCTPEMLARNLRIPMETATRIQARLLRQGIITPPVGGISLATHPTNTGCITNEAMMPNNLLQKAARLRERMLELIAEDDDAPQAAPLDGEMSTESRLNSPSTS